MQGFFSGRVSHRTYRRATIFVLALNVDIILALSLLFDKSTGKISLIVPLLLSLIGLGIWSFYMQLTVRRFHDIGRRGVWAWALHLPLAGLYFLGWLCFKRGDQGDNVYGLEPMDDGTRYTTPMLISLIAIPVFGFLNSSSLSYDVSRKSFKPGYTVTQIALQDRLQREPCHAQSAYNLSQSYLKSELYQPAIALEKDFHARCPQKIVQLQWVAFESAKRLQDFPVAEALIDHLIEHDPKDSDYRVWRGRMFESRGEVANAVLDFEEAIRLKPKLQNVPLNLAKDYRHLGKPCQALETHARYSKLYPEIMRKENMKSFRQALEKECRAAAVL